MFLLLCALFVCVCVREIGSCWDVTHSFARTLNRGLCEHEDAESV